MRFAVIRGINSSTIYCSLIFLFMFINIADIEAIILFHILLARRSILGYLKLRYFQKINGNNFNNFSKIHCTIFESQYVFLMEFKFKMIRKPIKYDLKENT